MLSGGLTNASIDRAAMLKAIEHNTWQRVGDTPAVLSAYVGHTLASFEVDPAAISMVATEWVQMGPIDRLLKGLSQTQPSIV